MKGSTGWVIFGVIVMFVLFIIVRLYYQDAVSYRLRHQNIVFGEVEILKVKNTLLLAEKSLPITWNLSSLRQIFDAGIRGFGSEFWHRINPADKSQTGKIPSTEEIKSYLEGGLDKYRGFSGVEDFNGVGLITEVAPELTLEDEKITAKVSGKLKTFAGDQANPSTQSQEAVESVFSYAVQFKKLIDAGKSFVQAAESIKLPLYSSTSDAYKIQADNSVMGTFNAVSTALDKKFSISNSRLLVPSSAQAGILQPLSGLIVYYMATGQFTEKQSLYHYLDENKFEKRPFSLTVKAEDYLVALNCASTSGLFAYSSSNDMACDGSRIYTCDTFIEGIDGNQLACGGRTGPSGNYGCGQSRYKTDDAVDESPCYCTAFGGRWIGGESWTCPRAVYTPVTNDKGEVIGEECTNVYDPYSCPQECDLNGRFCTPFSCPSAGCP